MRELRAIEYAALYTKIFTIIDSKTSEDDEIEMIINQAIQPFIDKIDLSARAYGWEVGKGEPLAWDIFMSPENPFKSPTWRDSLPERKD